MTTSSPFSYRCPKCKSMGQAVKVTTKPRHTVLHLICPYCQHKWTDSRPDPRAKRPA